MKRFYLPIINKKSYVIIAAAIVIIGFILRFYNYDVRWGLGYDQAHDAIVARYSLEHLKIPLVGPFSSGAQFQTSGIWYVFIAFSTLLYPYSIITPWIVLTFCFVVLIYLMIYLGGKMESKLFGVITGLFITFSPSQIAQSLNLSLTAPMCFITFGAIYAMVKFVKTKKLIFLFFLALFASLGPTTHLSGAVLLILLFVTIIFTKSINLKQIAVVAIGLIIPGIPLVIFDLQNNFVNSTGLFNTVFHNQFNVSYEVLGRRWLTYLGVFWPNAWGYIIGGNIYIGYLLFIGSGAVFTWKIWKRKITKEWLILFASFILMIGAIRYVRTPIFDSYLIFLHPFVLLFSAYFIYYIFLKNKIIALFLLIVVVGFSAQKLTHEIINASNNTIIAVRKMENELIKRFPNAKFSIYDEENKTSGRSVPLVLSLYVKNKISDEGIMLGFRFSSTSAEFVTPRVAGESYGYQIVDLSSSSSSQLVRDGWRFMNPSKLYSATEEWYPIQE